MEGLRQDDMDLCGQCRGCKLVLSFNDKLSNSSILRVMLAIEIPVEN